MSGPGGNSIDELRNDPTSFLDQIHPDDRSKAEASMARLQKGEPDIVEYRVETDDGDYLWVRGDSKPIIDERGSVSRIVGFVRDITDQKSRELDLRSRAEAMDAIADGIAILNVAEEYIFMNEAHAGFFGFDAPEALLGKNWRTCYDDSEIPRFENENLAVLFDVGYWRGEMTVTADDGQTFNQELTLSRVDERLVICVVRLDPG